MKLAFPEFLIGLLGSVAPLDNPAAFATAIKLLAEPLLKCETSPEDVQQAYRNRFPRHQVIDEYLRIFAGSNSEAGFPKTMLEQVAGMR